jgi:hypothetical protein
MRNYVAYAVVLGLLACSSSAVLLVAQESPRTIPCLIARLRSPDFTIDDQEIVIALNLWIAQSRVGPEIPQPISDEMMIKIIDLWVRGADCRGN